MRDLSYYYPKQNNIITGRGSTAIYLVFINEIIEGCDVIVPGNICYAAVYPVTASGNKPVFCDVDAETGNLTLALIQKYLTKKTKAIIAPHMYGNHIQDIDQISKWCRQNDIILIEDCASSFCSTDDEGIISGTRGDYVIYSFGHSKIMDLGNGGLLSSDRSLKKAEETLETMNVFNEKTLLLQKKFSDDYRDVRYKNGNYQMMRESLCPEIFFYRNADSIIESSICNINKIKQCTDMHIHNYGLYDSLLNKSLNRYHYSKGSIPWRFSLMLDEDVKKRIIHSLLENNLPVSDWYPNITEMFGESRIALKGVDEMEKRIINFPLDVDEYIIKNICLNINRVIEE